MQANDTGASLAVVATAPIETAEELGAAFLAAYSPATRRAYATDLRHWGTFLAEHGIAPLDARRVTVDAYVRQLELDGFSPATTARRLNALSGYYRYAVDERLIERSPVASVRRPKVADTSPQLGLDRVEMRRMLDVAQDSNVRDHALACLLILNGLRVSETLAADVEDFGDQRGHRTLQLTRKGGKRQLVALAPRTVEALEALIGDRASGPIFQTRSGRRLDRFAAGKIVKRLARDAGVAKTISAHSCRHGFVTAALDAGVSLRDVQDAAGHADPRTTRRYDRGRHSLDRHATYAVAAAMA